jgi:hypothetical protein
MSFRAASTLNDRKHNGIGFYLYVVNLHFKSHFVYPLGFAFSFDPTSRESRWHPIFCACPAIASKATADCQGFAVGNYSFTLGRLEAGVPSAFAQLGSKSLLVEADEGKTGTLLIYCVKLVDWYNTAQGTRCKAEGSMLKAEGAHRTVQGTQK